MGRRPRGLEAAALVDRDVDEHGAALHQPELLARDHVRRPRAVDEHRADHEVGRRAGAARSPASRRSTVEQRPPKSDVELAQAVDVAVEDEHVGLHADRDEGGVHADHAAADHEHVGGRHARHAAEQDPAAAERLLEHERARLRGDLARDLAHRREQRQPAVAVLDGLVGDAGRARCRPAPCVSSGCRREVQVGEQRVARLERATSSGCGSLTLTIRSASPNTASASGTIARALRRVVGVADRRALARAALDRAPRGRASASSRTPAG